MDAIDWKKVRRFVRGRVYCTAAVLDGENVRLFPIGSLRVFGEGEGAYFELFAKPTPEGVKIDFLAVDLSPWFWFVSLLRGRFSHPPALRLRGVVGSRRDATLEEQNRWQRRVGLLLKTPGGQAMWSRAGKVRQLQFTSVQPVSIGTMTKHLKDWGRNSAPLAKGAIS